MTNNTTEQLEQVREQLGDDDAWDAYKKYAENHHSELYGLPEVSEFREAYQGRWGEFKDYAYHHAEETGLQCDWPEAAVLHFNWGSYVESLEQGFHVEDAPGGRVYVFTA